MSKNCWDHDIPASPSLLAPTMETRAKNMSLVQVCPWPRSFLLLAISCLVQIAHLEDFEAMKSFIDRATFHLQSSSCPIAAWIVGSNPGWASWVLLLMNSRRGFWIAGMKHTNGPVPVMTVWRSIKQHPFKRDSHMIRSPGSSKSETTYIVAKILDVQRQAPNTCNLFLMAACATGMTLVSVSKHVPV